MRKLRRTIIIGFVITSCLSAVAPTCAAQQSAVDEAYKVYSVVLQAKYTGDKSKLLVVDRMTLKNSEGTSWELSDKFTLNAKIVLVDEERLSQVFGQKKLIGWEAFYQEFPDSGGYIRLSKVVFDAAMGEANVSVDHRCGWHCASGKYYTLKKENKEWRIKEERLVWVS